MKYKDKVQILISKESKEKLREIFSKKYPGLNFSNAFQMFVNDISRESEVEK